MKFHQLPCRASIPNPLPNGRDLYKEIQILGKDRIYQFHCTDEDGV